MLSGVVFFISGFIMGTDVYSDDYYALYINKVLFQIHDLSDGHELVKHDELKDVKYPPIYLDK